MAWYVFALIDAVPGGRAGSGLTGPLSVRKLATGFAVVERRGDVPPVEFGSLKQHQDVVARLARSVPAILPVRFGTLLEDEDFDEALDERDEEIAEAFDLVRGRVQFTWRTKRRGTAAAPAPVPRRIAKTAGPGSGTAYLRQAARAANPAPPAAFRPIQSELASLITAHRYHGATAAVPEAVYHLVDKLRAEQYASAARAVLATAPRLRVTGPFPPFAFAPEML